MRFIFLVIQDNNKNNFLCRIIRFYTNNPKCQYVYLSFYLNDYQIIDKVELPGGFAPLAPLPGLCPGPTGGLKRPQTPRPIILHPPFLILGYGPARCHTSKIFYWNLMITVSLQSLFTRSVYFFLPWTLFRPYIWFNSPVSQNYVLWLISALR